MLFCGAAPVIGTVLWNEVFCVITRVFGFLRCEGGEREEIAIA